MLADLTNASAELELADDVRVVVLTGAGKAFVAGADIAEMKDLGPLAAQTFAELGGNLGESIERSRKP